jgi:hypothetical protein
MGLSRARTAQFEHNETRKDLHVFIENREMKKGSDGLPFSIDRSQARLRAPAAKPDRLS